MEITTSELVSRCGSKYPWKTHYYLTVKNQRELTIQIELLIHEDLHFLRNLSNDAIEGKVIT